MSDQPRRKLKFIGCEILYREACRLAATSPHQIDVEFLRKGLHDLETADMAARVQGAIDAVDPQAGYEAILLGYARCNDGLVGVAAGDLPLVIPRAHDCITLFFGSRGAYRDYFDANPGTYYMTTGWCERNDNDGGLARPAYGQEGVMAKLGLTDSREQLVAKYGSDNADFILSQVGGWTDNYSALLYLEMGVCDEREFIEQGRREAAKHEWSFEARKGDWTLLDKLFLAARGRSHPGCERPFCPDSASRKLTKSTDLPAFSFLDSEQNDSLSPTEHFRHGLLDQWDDDFVIVRPGQKLIARNDELVLDVEDAGPP